MKIFSTKVGRWPITQISSQKADTYESSDYLYTCYGGFVWCRYVLDKSSNVNPTRHSLQMEFVFAGRKYRVWLSRSYEYTQRAVAAAALKFVAEVVAGAA